MVFYTKWNRPEKVMEAGGGTKVTDTTGFVPPRVLIQTYMDAGKRLQEWRNQEYQVPPKIVVNGDVQTEKAMQDLENEIPLDVTRSKGFTQVEADAIIETTAQRIASSSKKSKSGSAVETTVDAAGSVPEAEDKGTDGTTGNDRQEDK